MSENGRHATLYDFRDLDLLMKLEREADNAGWVEIAAAADSLGFGDDTRPLTSRFAWMKRFGMLEYDQPKKMWKLTDGAERVVEASRRAAQRDTLQELPDEMMIEVMSRVTQRYMHGTPMVASMLRREFLFGTKR